MKSFEAVVVADLLDPGTAWGAVTYGAGFLALAWAGNRALRFLGTRFLERDERHLDRTLVHYLVRLAGFGLDAILLTAYAHLIPALNHLGTALLAGVSVVSIVVGLAAQNSLGNLVAGVTLALYRPFQLGDRIQVNSPTGLETGEVEDLSLGYTTLRTFDNRRVVVPNGVMANQVIVNLTAVDARVMAVVPIGIGYDSDLDAARAILLELAAQHPACQRIEGCPVTRLGDSAVVLSLRAWCADAEAARQLEFDLLERAKKRFADAGIEIPFPSRTVVLRGAGAEPERLRPRPAGSTPG